MIHHKAKMSRPLPEIGENRAVRRPPRRFGARGEGTAYRRVVKSVKKERNPGLMNAEDQTEWEDRQGRKPFSAQSAQQPRPRGPYKRVEAPPQAVPTVRKPSTGAVFVL